MKLRIPYWATEGFDIKVNGYSYKSQYQPGSYVTLPMRRWSKNDTIEVIMPFTTHIDFGPDKMEVAATGKNEPGTRFEPMWCGAIMKGPLVMAKEGIKTWKEATIDLNVTSQLSTLMPQLIPDYCADSHVTHYFRIMMPGEPTMFSKAFFEENTPDDSRLKEAIAMARNRQDAQNAWNALNVKVPEYAPWAKHGYARLMEQLDRVQSLYDDVERSQTDIDVMTTELNAVLNTMRPGNLPELEDLDELLPLLKKAKGQTSPSSRLCEAIEYAEMVVKYVSDGSGTQDMIDRAVRQLKLIID